MSEPANLDLFRERRNLTVVERDLNSTGGNGTSGPMDPWQTSVESRLGQLHTDINQVRTDLSSDIGKLSTRVDSGFRWLIGAYASGFVMMAGFVIGAYLLTSGKIEKLGDGIDKVATAIAVLHH